jgi:alanine dehydrogenase
MGNSILVISQREIAARVDVDRAIEMVEAAFANYEQGNDILPDKLIFKVPGGIAACMASMLPAQDVLAMKLGQGREANPRRGLPNIFSQISLFDPDTGRPLAVMDGAWITGLRTGASAAVAVRHLARPDAEVITLVGAGFQGRHALAAALRVRKFRKAFVYDIHRPALEAFVAEMAPRLGVALEAAADPGAAIGSSDVVVTCTNTTTPLVRGAWVRPGTHLSSMGADQHWKQELCDDLHPRCAIFGDHIEQICHLGEISQPLEKGLITREQIRGRIGQVITGAIPGRTSADEITLFDGTGMAIQDAAVARCVYDLALAQGFGVTAEL